MYYLYVFAFSGALAGAWFLNFVSLPGNWLVVILAAGFAYFFPVEVGPGISWTIVGVLAGLAVIGEILEFVAGAAGVAKGGSKRGALLAILGSFIGSILGAILGAPIPVIGSLVGILLFSSLGAMAGAIAGEIWLGKEANVSVEIGKAAFWGRLYGSLGKILIGCVMVSTALAAALF